MESAIGVAQRPKLLISLVRHGGGSERLRRVR
jgi:hypothetical protein